MVAKKKTAAKAAEKTTTTNTTENPDALLNLDRSQAEWIFDMLNDYSFVIETARQKQAAMKDMCKTILDKDEMPEGVTREMVEADLESLIKSEDTINEAAHRRAVIMDYFADYLWIDLSAELQTDVEPGVVEWELIEEHPEVVQPVHETTDPVEDISQSEEPADGDETKSV